MRIAISNIAWDVEEDEQIGRLLNKYHIDAIDVAPTKYFKNPLQVSDDDIRSVRSAWRGRGVSIVGMQALLFGTEGLNMFGSLESQTSMLDHLRAIARIAANLQATRLVFGSPRNRDRAGLSDETVASIAKDFFSKLGKIGETYGVVFCLEPNPVRYNANFLTTSLETATMVAEINHPCIKMQLDMGAVTINKENIHAVLDTYASLIGHIHASEPDLCILGEGGTDHASFSRILRRYLENHILSIEMLPSKNEGHATAIERALRLAIGYYRREGLTLPKMGAS